MTDVITFMELGAYGALGNQLWQIAATIGIARAAGAEPRFPTWQYQRYFQVPDELFIDYTPVDHRDLGKQYFQELRFFENVVPQVRSWLKPAPEAVAAIRRAYPAPGERPHTTAVHVRRGDYVLLQTKHPVMSLEYFQRAGERVRADHSNTTFVVFSDDLEWCKSGPLQQALGSDVLFQDTPRRANTSVDKIPVADGSEIIDFILMTQCDAHIISNSTFSWWAAYLSDDPAPIYPSVWFGPELSHLPWQRMFDDRWTMVDATGSVDLSCAR